MIAGALLVFVAPRIGPNLFFGVRWGYTLSDKRVWDKVNRLVGLIFILVGLIATLGGLVGFFNIVYGALFIAISAILISVFSFWVSKRYAEYYLSYFDEGRGEVLPLNPFELTRLEYLFTFATFLTVFFFLLNMYFSLVSIRDFALISLHMSGILFLVTVVVLWIGKKHPIVFHSGVLKKRWGRDILFKLSVYGINAAQCVLLLTGIEIYYYALYNQFLIPHNFLLVIALIIALSPLFLLVKRWMMESDYEGD